MTDVKKPQVMTCWHEFEGSKKLSWRNPLKMIARWILHEEWDNFKGHYNRNLKCFEGYCEKLNERRDRIRELKASEERLSELVNKLKDEAYNGRGYIFRADYLTESEQIIIGKSIKHEMVQLFKKMFKAKADENADLLIHFPQENCCKRSGWSIAVRMYDDLTMQIERCEKIFNNRDRLKAIERKNAIRKKEERESV